MDIDSQTGIAGVIGFYDDPELLREATTRLREASVESRDFKNFEVYAPYPVHGLEKAQALKRSPIPYVTFVAGLIGCILAFSFEYWTSAVSWPLIVGGKPFNSWPAFVPVMFESTVLLAGISTLLALLFFTRLPNVKHRAYDPSITRDRFAIVIESAPLGAAAFDAKAAISFLEQSGAKDVRSVPLEAQKGWFS